MKCPECTTELINNKIPFAKNCSKCSLTWIIQTAHQSVQMGILNNELLTRNDLSQKQKVELLVARANELEKKT